MTTGDYTAGAARGGPPALERARALARALGESPEFRSLEAAQDGIHADSKLRRRLLDFQRRERELLLARSWGGADPETERALQQEWEALAREPALAAHLAAREELVELLRRVVAEITDGVGVDFGEACAPAAGCC